MIQFPPIMARRETEEERFERKKAADEYRKKFATAKKDGKTISVRQKHLNSRQRREMDEIVSRGPKGKVARPVPPLDRTMKHSARLRQEFINAVQESDLMAQVYLANSPAPRPVEKFSGIPTVIDTNVLVRAVSRPPLDSSKQIIDQARDGQLNLCFTRWTLRELFNVSGITNAINDKDKIAILGEIEIDCQARNELLHLVRQGIDVSDFPYTTVDPVGADLSDTAFLIALQKVSARDNRALLITRDNHLTDLERDIPDELRHILTPDQFLELTASGWISLGKNGK